MLYHCYDCFRHDLYHRLNVVKIQIPPLRERKEDIPELIQLFIDRFNKKYHREISGFDAQSMQQLMAHHWPGNIRELQNLIESHMALADGTELQVSGLSSLPSNDLATGPHAQGIDVDMPTLAELEKRYIGKILKYHDDNRERTAETLGINKSTLWRKLQSYKGKAEESH